MSSYRLQNVVSSWLSMAIPMHKWDADSVLDVFDEVIED